MNIIRPLIVAVVFLCLAFGDPSSVDACPNCKDALELKRAIAFGSSVLLLMCMPFALGMAWYTAMFKAAQRHDVNSARESASPADID